jgi:molybdopterin-guanine dinucleotide biosynthesis protein A
VALTIAAVVLAGGPADEVSAIAPGVPNKAFVPIAGTTLVARTIASLRSSSQVGRIVVVAPISAHDDPALRDADERRADGATMTESLRSGLVDFDRDELVLVVASDLPILSRAAIDEFIAIARRRDCDLAYACLEKRTHLAAYPEIPHTWARLRDGSYCGGGLVAMRPRALERLATFLGRLGAARKSPLRLAAIFGFPTLVRYAIGRLSIADAERRGCALVGISVAAIVSSQAEIAVNVDRASDVAIAERLVGELRR